MTLEEIGLNKNLYKTDNVSNDVEQEDIPGEIIFDESIPLSKLQYGVYDAVVESSGNGTYPNIKSAVDDIIKAGGGKIIIKNGTYVLDSNIMLSSNISIEGESLDGVIIDCNNFEIATDYEALYSTGTLSATHDSNIFTGDGTLWLSNLSAGDYVFLGDNPFEISSVDSDTQLTLIETYFGRSVSTYSYMAGTFSKNISLKNLTTKNNNENSDNAINIANVINSEIDNIKVEDCSGTSSYAVAFNNFYNSSATNIKIKNCDCGGLYIGGIGGIYSNIYIQNCSWYGAYINSCFFINATNFNISNVKDDAVHINTLRYSSLSNFIILNSGLLGVHLSTSSLYNVLNNISIDQCASDGLRIDESSSYNLIKNCKLTGNEGYGINITSTALGHNDISTNYYYNNSSGDYYDGFADNYVGGGYYILTASDVLKISADTERYKQFSATYTKVKEIIVRENGVIRVSFDIKKINSDESSSQARIYVNGVAVGTIRSSNEDLEYHTFTEDISIVKDDLVQLYYRTDNDANATCYVRNFRLYYDKNILDEYTINTN
jgi:hypothetical protein